MVLRDFLDHLVLLVQPGMQEREARRVQEDLKVHLERQERED